MTVSLTTLFGLAVMLPLAGLLVIWLYDEWRARKVRFVPTAAVMITCEICLFRFLCDKDARLARCPQCGSLTKARRSG